MITRQNLESGQILNQSGGTDDLSQHRDFSIFENSNSESVRRNPISQSHLVHETVRLTLFQRSLCPILCLCEMDI